jgi:hypothetical protein
METIMANVTYEIDEPTFKKLSAEDQNWILYTTFNKYRTDIEDRLCKIDKRKKVDKAFACGSGFLGGFIAFFTKDIF